MRIFTKILSGFILLILPLVSLSQTRQITGLIRDSTTKEPLPNVSIVVKGQKTGISSSPNGTFTLSASGAGITLLVRSVGYKNKEIQVGEGSTALNIFLSPSSETLGDVVVVAYGTQKRSSLTSAISTLNAKELEKVPVPDVSNAIGGRVAGVVFKQTSGEPGNNNANIKIRGVATIGNANALIMIDGIERPLSFVDPHDIESMSILKDAASVAPYGLRGANGVVLITTKRGSDTEGKVSINYDGRTAFERVTNQPEQLSGFEWATMKNVGAANEGVALPYNAEALRKLQDGSDPNKYANESVTKRLFKTGKLQQHSLTIAGGSKSVNFFGSLGYLDQSAIWGDVTNYQRYTLRANVDVRVSENTKISFDINSAYRKTNYPGAGNAGYLIFGFWRLNPTNPIYYTDGKPAGYFERNPYLDLYSSGYLKEDNYKQFITLKLDQKIPFVPGLSAKVNISVDRGDSTLKNWRTPYTFYQIQQDGSFLSGKGNVPSPTLRNTFGTNRQITGQLILNYNKRWGKHAVDVLGVFEPRVTDSASLYGQRVNYALNIPELNTGSGDPADISNGGSSARASQVGYVYRLSYNYASKYFFESAGRYDGHYYFAPGKRFAFFPSVSAAWRLSEESFLKNSKTIDNLKLRASWGKSGNLAGTPFQYLRQYVYTGSGTYIYGNSGVPSVSEKLEPNPFITWEKAAKTNVGVDLEMWKGLLNATVDVFYEKRANMLNIASTIVPLEYGVGLAQENNSTMENRGIELQLSSRKKINDNLNLYASLSITYAVNKLLDVKEAESTKNNPNRSLTGKAYGTQFGYRSLGLFQSAEEIEATPYAKALGNVKPGDIKYDDIDRNGLLNADDNVVIGKPLYPQLTYGLTLGANFKKFNFDMLWAGAGSVDYYLAGWAATPFNQGNGTAFKFQQDYWTPDNRDAEFPRILTNPAGNAYNNYRSSFWMRNGNYIRLKTITLSYSFDKLPSGIGIKSARLYVTGQNLLTITKTKYIDPETASTTDYYPQTKAYAVGLNLIF